MAYNSKFANLGCLHEDKQRFTLLSLKSGNNLMYEFLTVLLDEYERNHPEMKV